MLNRVIQDTGLERLEQMLSEYEGLFPELCEAGEIEIFLTGLKESIEHLSDREVKEIDRAVASATD